MLVLVDVLSCSCSHLVHACSSMSVDNSTDDSAANVDFIKSFSKLRDVRLFVILLFAVVIRGLIYEKDVRTNLGINLDKV